MRRNSIVAPLLLIGLGALLLARNLYPELALADYIGRFWPYVLIGWGVLRLAEIVFLETRAKPLPRRGVSGGEWVLVVFLVLIGSGFHATHNLPQNWGMRIPWGNVDIFNEHFEYPVSADRAASKTPHITLEDFRGDVTILGSDNDVVKVTGRKTIGAVNKKFADEADASSHFAVTGDDNNITIRLKEGADRGPVRISASLEIGVPKGASITARRRDGDLRVTGVDGAVDVGGRGSDVDVEDIRGPVNIEGTFTGSIHARNVAKAVTFKGRNTQFSVENVPGDLMVDSGDFSATDVVGPTRITSHSNDVSIMGFTNALEVSLDRGDLNLAPGKLLLGPIKVHSRSGDIHLALPEGAQFSINASTGSGDIVNNFGATLKLDDQGPRQTLSGSVGSGPAIAIDTRRGDIAISKAIGVPAGGSPSQSSPSKGAPTKGVLEKLDQ